MAAFIGLILFIFADIPIWSVLELDNYVWHKNFTYPNTPNYKSLKKEFEKEVSITQYIL